MAAALAAASPARAAAVRLLAFDERGAPLDLAGLAARLSRADARSPDPRRLPLWALPDDGTPPVRAALSRSGDAVVASWSGGPARLELVWLVPGDGYGDVLADDDGHGFADGATVALDEAVARTQYRLFKESWRRRATDWVPPYAPDRRVRRLSEDAARATADALRVSAPAPRAAAFQKALGATARAWDEMLCAHGRALARDRRRPAAPRFGLTLDDSILKRLADLDWIVGAVERSGSGWVRLVFRPNPEDFAYASLRSFNEYDGIVDALRRRGIRVMGAVLDTGQWPRTLTPEVYAARVKNLVLHYKGRVTAWEVGSELNGNWLGGAAEPLTAEQVFRIYAAGAARAKELDPDAEMVATLYWWEAAAPDREHSLSGWLRLYVPRGFGGKTDVVGLELYPEDSPVGPAFERAFDETADALPGKTLMLSSFGYGEDDERKGYWWLAPDDADGARKDLVALYLPASCAMRASVCGGFWWQTLDWMLPAGRRRATDLFAVYRRALSKLARGR